MENNALQVDYSEWEAGKQYPEWMDEISLANYFKRLFTTRRNSKNGI